MNKCSYCGKIFKNTQGLSGHIRFNHESQSNTYKKHTPVYSNKETPVYTDYSNKEPETPRDYLQEPEVEKPSIDIFEQLRNQEEQKLIILELRAEHKRLSDELNGVKPIQKQESDLDKCLKYLEIQNDLNQSKKMQQRALKQENLSEIEEDEEDDYDDEDEEEDFLK